MLKINDSVTLSWLRHASFKLKAGDRVIYIDPWKVKKGEGADLILITHSHFDHLSPDDVNIQAIPAYNIGKSYHPKVNGWVGFIVTISGKRIYHAGDTDAIPEMKKLSVDVALFHLRYCVCIASMINPF